MATTPQEPLQDRLKEQVSVSVKEALERTTTILSNLHRVHSYLDIICNVSSPRDGHGVKNALDQMRNVRNETASLLQTVYLAEIGIQSLQDCEKGGMPGPASFNSLMPILGVSGDDGLVEGERREEQDGEMGEVVASLANPSYEDSVETPAKKSKLSGVGTGSSMSIVVCSSCNKRFANNHGSLGPHFCRNCRSQGYAAEVDKGTQSHTSSHLMGSDLGRGLAKKDISSQSTTTPRSSRGGARGNLNRLSCKLCRASFLYRRCLHRHIRENHTDLDLNNLSQYIQVCTTAENLSPGEGANASSLDGSLESNLRGVVVPDPSLMGKNNGIEQVLVGVDEGVNSIISSDGVELMEGSGDKMEERGVALEEGEESGDVNGKYVKYVCPTCSKSFDRPYRLQRHLQIHNPNRPKVTCHMCDKSFTRMDTLENHIKCLHSDERPFKCTYTGCPKSFPLQSALIHHLKVHMDGKPYKCNECEETFALLGEFRTHISEKHADTKNLRCSECYKVFPSTSILAQHVKLEHRLECEVCMRTFSRLAYLQSHIKVHNGQSLFNCRFCSAGFDSEYAYKKHIKCHPKHPKGLKLHPCTICDLTFRDTDDLMMHYRSEEHREKVQALGLGEASILHTIEGDLSPEIRSLVDEVTGSIGAAEVDERLMESLRESHDMLRAATVTIDPVDSGGFQGTGENYQNPHKEKGQTEE